MPNTGRERPSGNAGSAIQGKFTDSPPTSIINSRILRVAVSWGAPYYGNDAWLSRCPAISSFLVSLPW